jgi:hypothetical protein
VGILHFRGGGLLLGAPAAPSPDTADHGSGAGPLSGVAGDGADRCADGGPARRATHRRAATTAGLARGRRARTDAGLGACPLLARSAILILLRLTLPVLRIDEGPGGRRGGTRHESAGNHDRPKPRSHVVAMSRTSTLRNVDCFPRHASTVKAKPR